MVFGVMGYGEDWGDRRWQLNNGVAMVSSAALGLAGGMGQRNPVSRQIDQDWQGKKREETPGKFRKLGKSTTTESDRR